MTEIRSRPTIFPHPAVPPPTQQSGTVIRKHTPYLRCLSLQTARSRLSFASEEAFASFIKKKDFPAYDASYPLYRWNFRTNGTIIASHVGGVGKITGVSVTERGPGGVAMKLLVKGSEGETTISGSECHPQRAGRCLSHSDPYGWQNLGRLVSASKRFPRYRRNRNG